MDTEFLHLRSTSFLPGLILCSLRDQTGHCFKRAILSTVEDNGTEALTLSWLRPTEYNSLTMRRARKKRRTRTASG